MAFKLVYHSQQDEKWKNDLLGFGTGKWDTIGYNGCALSSVAMLLSGYGYTETPQSLNERLKSVQGFAGSGIRWGAVSQLYPAVKLASDPSPFTPYENSDAPLEKINASLDVGRPVIVRVDTKPTEDKNIPDEHYILLYARNGSDDYLILDPWPYKPGTNTQDSLMKRYSHGRTLRQIIQRVVVYDVAGAGGPIVAPGSTSSSTVSSTSTPTSTPTMPVPSDGIYVRVLSSVSSLPVRANKALGQGNVLASVAPGTLLRLVNPEETKRIGRADRWVTVREPGGKQGFAEARYLEIARASTSTSTPAPVPAPSPGTETPAPTESQSTPAAPPANALKLVVSEALGTSTLNLRKKPSTDGVSLMALAAGTQLTVLESAGEAKAKIGKSNKWIYVSEPGGTSGYTCTATKS